MRVCPKCGYVEPIEWRPTSWKAGQYVDCCRLTDLEVLNPQLARELKERKQVIRKHYVYKLSRTGVWVLRRWIEIWKIQGWKEIPAERHGFYRKINKKSGV